MTSWSRDCTVVTGIGVILCTTLRGYKSFVKIREGWFHSLPGLSSPEVKFHSGDSSQKSGFRESQVTGRLLRPSSPFSTFDSRGEVESIHL